MGGTLSHRIHSRAVAGLAVLAATAGGIAALTSTAQAATAASAVSALATVGNGPIAYTDGAHWSVVNADGSGRRTVTPSGGGFQAGAQIRDVAFSHDGSWAAFSVTSYSPPSSSLWVSSADGTHARRIVASDPGGGDLQPAWSADAKTIVFTSYSLPSGAPQLMSVPSDGSAAPTPVLPKPSVDASYGDNQPSVAPNGDVAFTAHTSSSMLQLEIYSPATKTVKTVSSTNSFQGARFSPDGSKIVAVSQNAHGPNLGVWVMAADGSGQQQITSTYSANCFGDTGLSWSPDGAQIAFPECGQSATDSSKLQITVHVQAATPGAAVATALPATDAPMPQGFLDWGAPFTPPTSQNPGRPDPAQPPVGGRPYTLRLGGSDRIATAVAVADAAYGSGSGGAGSAGKAKVAVLSRSDNYADALAGNALAAQKGGPLLLTGSAKLDPTVGAELGKLLPKGSTVYVLGGVQALSPQVDAGIRALGLIPKRLAGSDRFETATKIATEISPHPHTILVATGINAPDALAAGAAAATDPNGGVVLLSNDKVLPPSTRAFLAGVKPSVQRVFGVGAQGVAALNTMPGFIASFTKLAGSDRYATDAAVANDVRLYPHPTQATLATGRDWPDALSGGAYAGVLHAPLLLTDGAVVPGGAGAWLHAHGAALTFVPVFGGPKAVPDSAVRVAGAEAWGAGKFDMR